MNLEETSCRNFLHHLKLLLTQPMEEATMIMKDQVLEIIGSTCFVIKTGPVAMLIVLVVVAMFTWIL